jgi:hypothetical protein
MYRKYLFIIINLQSSIHLVTRSLNSQDFLISFVLLYLYKPLYSGGTTMFTQAHNVKKVIPRPSSRDKNIECTNSIVQNNCQYRKLQIRALTKTSSNRQTDRLMFVQTDMQRNDLTDTGTVDIQKGIVTSRQMECSFRHWQTEGTFWLTVRRSSNRETNTHSSW